MSSHTEPIPVEGVPVMLSTRVRCKVRTPRGTTPLVGYVTARRAYTVLCHWLGGRTVLHWRPDEACPGCQQRQRPFPRAWLSCVTMPGEVPYVVQLTPTAFRSCPALDPRNGHDLRGLQLVLQHETTGGTSAIRAALYEPRLPGLTCPEAVSVRRFLEDMWRLPVGTLGEDQES